MCYKGFQAIALSRVAHHYWNEPNGTGVTIARLLQSEASDIFGVDIHPAASIGGGAVLDHGTGVVIGETAALGENVYLMHDVTLGATGTSGEHDRHPKVESNVFLGAHSPLHQPARHLACPAARCLAPFSALSHPWQSPLNRPAHWQLPSALC